MFFWPAVAACLALVLGAATTTAAAVPRLKVLDTSASESASALRFTVRLTGNTERPVRVSYSTVSETATAGADFSTVMGQLGFQPATKKRMIVVNILPDEIVEGKETLAVKLWKPIGASIARRRATGTIRDDDVPAASIVHYAGLAFGQALRPF
jgi:Calx-beta domain